MNLRGWHIGLGVLRWAARVSAASLVLMLMFFLVGEGGPDPFHSSALANLQHLAFLVIGPLGLLIGWRHELLGAAMTLGAMLAFYALEYAAVGRLPGGAFPIFFIPPLLYLADDRLRHRIKE